MRTFPWSKLRAADKARKDKKARARAYYAAHADRWRVYAAARRAEESANRRAELEATVARLQALATSGTLDDKGLAELARAEKRLRMSDAQRARRVRELVE